MDGVAAAAHFYLMLSVDATKYLKSVVAIIFFDVSNAFATLLRRIVFDIGLGDEVWLKKLSTSGCSEEGKVCIYIYIYSFSK